MADPELKDVEEDTLWVGRLAPSGSSFTPNFLRIRSHVVGDEDIVDGNEDIDAAEESAAVKAKIQREKLISKVLQYCVIALHLVLHPLGYALVYKPLPGDHSGKQRIYADYASVASNAFATANLITMYLTGLSSLALYIWLRQSNPGTFTLSLPYSPTHLNLLSQERSLHPANTLPIKTTTLVAPAAVVNCSNPPGPSTARYVVPAYSAWTTIAYGWETASVIQSDRFARFGFL